MSKKVKCTLTSVPGHSAGACTMSGSMVAFFRSPAEKVCTAQGQVTNRWDALPASTGMEGHLFWILQAGLGSRETEPTHPPSLPTRRAGDLDVVKVEVPGECSLQPRCLSPCLPSGFRSPAMLYLSRPRTLSRPPLVQYTLWFGRAGIFPAKTTSAYWLEERSKTVTAFENRVLLSLKGSTEQQRWKKVRKKNTRERQTHLP